MVETKKKTKPTKSLKSPTHPKTSEEVPASPKPETETKEAPEQQKVEATVVEKKEEVTATEKKIEEIEAEKRAYIQIRNATKETVNRAFKTLAIDPIPGRDNIKRTGALSSFSFGVLVVVDALQFVEVVDGLLLDSVTRKPDFVEIVDRAKVKTFFAITKHKFITFGDLHFDYVDLLNAMKVLRMSDDRFVFHFFKSKDDAMVLIQNSNLETAMCIAKLRDVLTSEPVTLQVLSQEYKLEQSVTKTSTIDDFLKDEPGSGLDKWGDFEA